MFNEYLIAKNVQFEWILVRTQCTGYAAQTDTSSEPDRQEH